MPGHSLVDEIGTKSGEGPGIPPVDLAGQAQVVHRNETTNIDCGFWSGAFAFDEDDTTRLRYLQEHVGRRGKCLKKDREEDKFDAIQATEKTIQATGKTTQKPMFRHVIRSV
jgi:hypothetical protein